MARTLGDRLQAGLKRLAAKGPGQRTLDVAFVKATSHDDGPPKEKHLRTLVEASKHGTSEMQSHLAGLIESCLLESADCVVVAKTLVILHKVLREGGTSFRQDVFYKSFSHFFDRLGNFKDDRSRHSWQLSTFIRAHSAFLNQRCVLNSSYPCEEGGSRLGADLCPAGLVTELPLMQKAVDLGLQVGTSNDIVGERSPRTLQGYAQHLVLADVLAIVLGMMRALPTLVESFFATTIKTSLTEAKEMVLIYQESRDLIERMSNLDESRLGQWGGLELKVPPQSVKESMVLEIEKIERLPPRERSASGLTDASDSSSPPRLDFEAKSFPTKDGK